MSVLLSQCSPYWLGLAADVIVLVAIVTMCVKGTTERITLVLVGAATFLAVDMSIPLGLH